MIVFAPRQVTLPPQPAAVDPRVGARAAGAPRWRISRPPAVPRHSPADPGDRGRKPSRRRVLAFQLIPVYGVTIPVIVRLGNLQAKAGIANVHLESRDGKPPSRSTSAARATARPLAKCGCSRPASRTRSRMPKAVAVYKEVDDAQRRRFRSTPRSRVRIERPGHGPVFRNQRRWPRPSPKPRRSCARASGSRAGNSACVAGAMAAQGRLAAAGGLGAARRRVGARRPFRPLRAGPPIPTTSSCSTSTSASCRWAMACAPTRRPKAPASSSAIS